MRHGLFNDTDLTALTRALIPWTAAVILPDREREPPPLLQRTSIFGQWIRGSFRRRSRR